MRKEVVKLIVLLAGQQVNDDGDDEADIGLESHFPTKRIMIISGYFLDFLGHFGTVCFDDALTF